MTTATATFAPRSTVRVHDNDMPMLIHDAGALAVEEETLIADPRGHLTPAQMVESKLLTLMKRTLLPISSLHTSARYCCR